MKTLFTFLLFTIASFSQINYGLKAGMLTTISKSTLTSFEVNTNIPTDPGIGFYLGGFLEKSINKSENLFFSTGLQLKQVAMSFNSTTNNFIGISPIFGLVEVEQKTFASEIRISSLLIPFILKYKPTEKFSFSGGMYAGYIANISTKYTDSNENYNGNNPDYSKSDFGLVIETSYGISPKLFIELKYEKGLNNLASQKENAGFNSFSSDIRIQNFGIGLGYKLK